MKKLIFCFIIMMSCITLQAQQYRDVFCDVNSSTTIGFHFGAIGQVQHLGLQVAAVSITAYGVYLDFGGWPQTHEYDYTYRRRIEDNRAWFAHIGYQIPITHWLRIIPMCGYAQDESGFTDTHRGYYDYYGDHHNDFITTEKVEGFDFGGQVVFSIPISETTDLNITGTYTRYCWYGGIGINFNF